MTVTIQELIGFANGMGQKDQKSFEGLALTVLKAEEPQDGQYGTMQRIQARDATGSRWFSAMDCPRLVDGEQIVASGRLKGGPKGVYWNLTSVQPAGDTSAAAPRSALPASAGPPRHQRSGPAPQGRPVKTMDQCDAFIRAALDNSEAWPLKEEQPRQALVTTLLIAWLRGEISWDPYYQDMNAPDSGDIAF